MWHEKIRCLISNRNSNTVYKNLLFFRLLLSHFSNLFMWCANLHIIECNFKDTYLFILRQRWIDTENNEILALGLEEEKRGFNSSVGMF